MNLQLSMTTWVVFSATVFLWGLSFLLLKKVVWRDEVSLKIVFISLFGYAWAAFFVDFILRFLVLVYNPELFRRTNFPLWLLPERALSRTWLHLLIFWGVFCCGFLIVYSWLPKRGPKILFRLDLLGYFHRDKIKVLDAIMAMTLIAAIWVNSPEIPTPRIILTPLGRFSALYVIPLVIAWGLYYNGQPIKSRRFIYILPGIITYILSPYREHLLVLLLCWLIPAVVVGGKISTKKILVVLITFFIVGTILNSAYREIKWGPNVKNEERQTWVLLSNRFHGFDSMSLTVYAVPHIFPYSERPIIRGLIYQVIPRMFFPSKKEVRHARQFSTSIWAIDKPRGVIERPSAMIAPSISGDLYSIHGVFTLILGAFLWGGIVGYLDRWVRGLKPVGRCVLFSLFGLCVAGGLERDFVNAAASIIHLVIIVLLMAAFLPFKPRI